MSCFKKHYHIHVHKNVDKEVEATLQKRMCSKGSERVLIVVENIVMSLGIQFSFSRCVEQM